MHVRLHAAWLARRVLGGVWRRVLPEESRLRRAWTAYPPELLDRYLVMGYQNPRINVQSALLRDAIVARLFGPGLEAVMDEEIAVAIELNDTLREEAARRGVRMGSYLNPWRQSRVLEVDRAIADREHRFEDRWRGLLANRHAPPLRVLELACGSANDYRSWAAFGLAPHVAYTGLDITPANIENARTRFPEVDFVVGSVLDLPFEDRSYDLVVASDIFEHLSIEGVERALGEAVRVTRDGLVLTFFNMGEGADHAQHPTRLYQWNRLSRPRIEARLRAAFPSVEVVRIHRWLTRRYGFDRTFNRHAYTIVAARAPLLEWTRASRQLAGAINPGRDGSGHRSSPP
jgi:SAM-dependent methyltransferase